MTVEVCACCGVGGGHFPECGAHRSGVRWMTEWEADDLDAKWKLGHIEVYQLMADDVAYGRLIIERMSMNGGRASG